ncbi:MAG TPA: hypothetical protein VGB94_06270 [Acidobacteriaceae bacterium]
MSAVIQLSRSQRLLSIKGDSIHKPYLSGGNAQSKTLSYREDNRIKPEETGKKTHSTPISTVEKPKLVNCPSWTVKMTVVHRRSAPGKHRGKRIPAALWQRKKGAH